MFRVVRPIIMSLCVFLSSALSYSAEIAAQVVNLSGAAFYRFEQADKTKPAPAPIQLKQGDQVPVGAIINTASNGRVKLLLVDKSIIDIGPSTLFSVNDFKKNSGADREVDLEMKYGSVRAAVSQKLEGKGKFTLKTSSATMGVRGTEFVAMGAVPSDVGTSTTANTGAGSIAPTQPTEVKVFVTQGKVVAEIPSSAATPATSQTAAQAATPGKEIALDAGSGISLKQDASLSGDRAPASMNAAATPAGVQVFKMSDQEKQQALNATAIKDNTVMSNIVVADKSESKDQKQTGMDTGSGAATKAAIVGSVASEIKGIDISGKLPPIGMTNALDQLHNQQVQNTVYKGPVRLRINVKFE